MATDMIARAMAGNTKKELDNYKNNPDVVDVVQNKAALNAYDTSKLTENDLVKVLDDESKNHMQTYYKWVNNDWSYSGGLGPKADLTNTQQEITAAKLLTKVIADNEKPTKSYTEYDWHMIRHKVLDYGGTSQNIYLELNKNNGADCKFTVAKGSYSQFLLNYQGAYFNTYWKDPYDSDNPTSRTECMSGVVGGYPYASINKYIEGQGKLYSATWQMNENGYQVKYNTNTIKLDPTTDKLTYNGNEIIDAGNISNHLPAKQDPIDVDHKLDADLVDDTSSTNKFVTATEKSQITTNANDIAAIKNGTTLNSFGDVETALAGITPSHLYRMHLKIGTDYAVIGITPTIDIFEVGQTYTVYDGTYRLTSDQRTAMKKVLSGISGNETEVPFQLYGALVNKTTRTCIELTDFSGVTEVKLDFNSTSNNVYTAGGTWTLKFTQLT